METHEQQATRLLDPPDYRLDPSGESVRMVTCFDKILIPD